jgi:hypothetical protein
VSRKSLADLVLYYLANLVLYYPGLAMKGKANLPNKTGKGGDRLPASTPAVLAAARQSAASATPPSSKGDHRSSKARRLGEQEDQGMDSQDELDLPPGPPLDIAAMFARIMQTNSSMSDQLVAVKDAVVEVNTKLTAAQADTNAKFEEVHGIIEAQNARIAAFTEGRDPWAAADESGSIDPGLLARIDALESKVKECRVDPPPTSASSGYLAAAQAASSGGPPMQQNGPSQQPGGHKPNVVWIKGLKTNLSSTLLKAIATQVVMLIPGDLHAEPVTDIRSFGKQFVIVVKDGDSARAVVEYFRANPIQIQHPVGGGLVDLNAYRDKSLELRLKDRLLGALWKRIIHLKGEGNIKLTNNRGSLWVVEPSGEVWDLFAAIVDCSGRVPSFHIVPNPDHLLRYGIEPGTAKAWIDEATREVGDNISRFRSGR